MSDTPLSAEQRERLRRFTLTPEEIPEAYARLERAREDDGEMPTEPIPDFAEIEQDLLLQMLADSPLLPDEQIAAYLDATLSSIEKACFEGILESDPEARIEVQRMRRIRHEIDALPPQEVAPLPTHLLTDTIGPLTLEAEEAFAAEQRAFPPSIAARIRELLNTGIVAPLASIREVMGQMHGMPAPALRSGEPAPQILTPRATALRFAPSLLRWQPVPQAQQYTVTLARQDFAEQRTILWKQSAGTRTEIVLPVEVALDPEHIYLWQVTATVAGQQRRSPFAWFLILSETARQEIDALETRCGELALARAGLYEAYGLYEEALIQTQRLADLNPGHPAVQALHWRLQALLESDAIPMGMVLPEAETP